MGVAPRTNQCALGMPQYYMYCYFHLWMRIKYDLISTSLITSDLGSRAILAKGRKSHFSLRNDLNLHNETTFMMVQTKHFFFFLLIKLMWLFCATDPKKQTEKTNKQTFEILYLNIIV